MSYLDRYKSRIAADEGNSIGESYKNDTIELINDDFTDDPFYKKVKINGVDTEVKVVYERDDSGSRFLQFRPNTVKPYGATVDFGTSDYWLIFDFIPNDIYPKAHIRLCNSNLKWKDKGGIIHSYISIATNSTKFRLTFKDRTELESSEIIGDIFAFASSNTDTNNVQYNQRFIINGQVYEVIGIDNVSNYGIVQYTMKFANKNDADDFVNGIADNSILYGGASAGTPPITGTGGGGLW